MDGITVLPRATEQSKSILTPEALQFIAHLHRKFNSQRIQLLKDRTKRQSVISKKGLDFLPETENIRNGQWKVADVPEDLQKRWVEITGPVSPTKMVINALNSGACCFMADFEDALAPHWERLIDGQVNLKQAIQKKLTFKSPEGKLYQVNKDSKTVLIVRPRGLHLLEKHVLIDGTPISGSIFDFGLYFFHNAKNLLANNSGPYFYLPKLESHLEARLWNTIFNEAQDLLSIPNGTIKATVLIETITAAFEMEEILYELRDHCAGLNAGRWDYIFSVIKKFKNHNFVLPDRGFVTMTVPFMDAYAKLLVKTCHKRGAHAMGGMAAFIPTKDENTNKAAFKKVSEDKTNEAKNGFDGTWVAHPGLVKLAMDIFEKTLQGRNHQKDKQRNDNITSSNLLNFRVEGGKITEEGVRININAGCGYISAWLKGEGAVAINNLMEDAATAEISRAQLWQWIKNRVKLEDGREFTKELYCKIRDSMNIQDSVALEIFDDLVLRDDFVDFLTFPAYERVTYLIQSKL